MPRPPLDLGRERDDCPARYHGTLSAYTKAGCVCPTAVQQRNAYDRQHDRQYYQDRRDGAPGRRQDLDPQAVRYAIAGHFDADQLTTPELKQVVAHLATVRRMTDREIAVHLRWSPDPVLGRGNVLRFRRWHRIPAGVPATHQRTREAVAA